MHFILKIILRISCIIGLFLLFNEYLIYYVKIYGCKWPELVGAKITKAMILADVHMLGPYHGHWADKLRREWQMHRAFQTALVLHQPDVVFILGDLFDEGQIVSDVEFSNYVIRFRKLFHVPDGVQMFGALGNHDVGFHYRLNRFLMNRYKRKVYKNPPNALVTVNDVNFVLINSMAMEADNCTICKAAERDISRIARRLKCAQAEDAVDGFDSRENNCSNIGKNTAHSSRPVLLQHFPTYRDSDENCVEHDDAQLEVYRERWEVLSKESTDWLAKVLDPRAVFSGHSHRFCRTTTSWGVEEYTISSFNWRNINNPKFLMATITSDQYAVEVCEVPHESTVIAIYAYGLFVSVVAVLVLSLCEARSADNVYSRKYQ